MARKPRISLANHPHHILQQGNNHQAIFQDEEDKEIMLEIIKQYSIQYKTQIHAYILMPNHIHIIATPPENKTISELMQSIGTSYSRKFNNKHKRTGTLFQGRYRSTILQPEKYLINTMIYIDQNPVRAKITQTPQEYKYSSHNHYIGIETNNIISPHPLFWELANTPFAREKIYKIKIQEGLSENELKEIQKAVYTKAALGDNKFITQLEKISGVEINPKKRGRPTKQKT